MTARNAKSKAKDLEVHAPDGKPVRVPSTRADGGPGKDVAVRAAAVVQAGGPLGAANGPTHQIQTLQRPDLTITVSDDEYQMLLASGLVYSGNPVTPAADATDLLFASKVSGGTATPAALRAAFDARYDPIGAAAGLALVLGA